MFISRKFFRRRSVPLKRRTLNQKFMWFASIVLIAPLATAIKEGADDSSMNKSVFMQKSSQPGQNNKYCSSVNMKHDRCLVTSKACLPTWINTSNTYFRTRIGDYAHTQPASTWTVNTDDKSPFGVIWLKNLQDKAGVKRIQAGRDYLPLDFGSTLGMQNYTAPFPPTGPSTGGPVSTQIFGYGSYWTYGVPPSIDGPDFGIGKLRKGLPLAKNYVMANSSTNYNITDGYWVYPNTEDGYTIGCEGDQGGPLLASGKVHGILISVIDLNQVSTMCAFINFGYYPSIGSSDGNASTNSSGDSDFNTNYKWVLNTIKTTCRKTILTGIEPEATGTVTGTVTPAVTPLTTDPGKEFNGEINYDGITNTDYKEALHTGESIVLQAQPNTGFHFVKWRSVLPYVCPCANSTNPSCEVTYNNIGVYTPDVSIDDAICAAVFEKNPTCGDSILDSGEQCDDGNTINGDGCSATCTLEYCGNQILDSYEQCDDGNPMNGDGCSAACRNEFCGDGIAYSQQGEQCDDGNTVNGDLCSSTCQDEICGDQIVQLTLNEVCDDGNPMNGDGCSATCQPEVCGDGVVYSQLGEQCDDGNALAGDGCSDTCQNEFCGDQVVQELLQEQCDDGNTMSGDGCSAICTIEPPLSNAAPISPLKK